MSGSGPPAAPHPQSETTFEDPNERGKRHAFGDINNAATIDLSIVVPAYNEEDRLPKMLDETLEYLEKRRLTNGLQYEVIIVDDGSRDGTVFTVERYSVTYGTEHVRLLRLQRNCGKGGAVRRGMLSARGRRVLMADADAATVFSELEALEDVLTGAGAGGGGGVDVAVGSRAHMKMQRDLLRSFVSFFFHLLVVIVGGVVGISDTQCGFKLYTRRAAKVAFEGQRLSRWAFDVENLYRCQRAGLVIVEVPVKWTEVPGSKLSVVKATVNMATDMVRMRYNYVIGNWQSPQAMQ